MSGDDGWQPIETAPRDGTRMLLWVAVNEEPVIAAWCVSRAPYRFEGWSTGWETASGYDVGYASIGDPTHWRPLPAPPQEASDER
jgi:hypothetical protein